MLDFKSNQLLKDFSALVKNEQRKMALRKDIQDLRDKFSEIKKTENPMIHADQMEFELSKILGRSYYWDEVALRKHGTRLESWKDIRVEMAKSTVAFGQTAIRTLTIINGGAILALLTFLGRLADTDPALAANFADALLYFSGGLVAACFVAMSSYVVQFSYETGPKLRNFGVKLHYAAVAFAIVSLVLFVGGIWRTYLVLIQQV